MAFNSSAKAEISGAKAMLDALVEIGVVLVHQETQSFVPVDSAVPMDLLDYTLVRRMPSWASRP